MKKKMGLIGLAVSAALAGGFSGAAMATDGYQLIGIGQYAMGMAGAVVAAPDDPLSAAISNPAGLADIRPQAAYSAEIFNPVRRTNYGFGEFGSHSNVYGVPAIGWVAPAFGNGIVFGGGVYGSSGLGTNYLQTTPYGTLQAYSNIMFMQMAPSLAMKVNRHLSLGASLNISAEQASFQQTFGGQGLNLASPSWAYGVGATIGALYRVNSMVTLGFTYKTPIAFTPLTWQETGQQAPLRGNPGQYSGHLNYPQQIALGLAIRPIPQWLVSIEGQWINWHATMNNFTIYGPWQGAGSVPLPMHWNNEWVANIGTQYALTHWLQVRMGYAYGTNPITSSNIGNNLIFPAIVENALTIGSTQKLGMGWKLTEAYMHEFSNTVTGTSPFAQAFRNFPLQPASATLSENSYGIQIGYVF